MWRCLLLACLALASCKGDKPAPAKKQDAGVAKVVPVDAAPTNAIATAEESEGTVEVRKEGTTEWVPVTPGTPLRKQDAIRTGKAGFAKVQFGKRGYLELGEETMLVIDDEVLLETGSFFAVAEPGAEPIVVRTAEGEEAAIAAAEDAPAGEQTKIRVSQNKNNTLVVAVTKGKATVTAANGAKAVEVSAGQATDVTKEGASPVVNLLPYPKSIAPGIDARFQFVAGKPIRLEWSSVKDALRYQVVIARDTEFKKLVQSAEGTATSTTFVPDKPGMYAWRVAARDTGDRLGDYGFARRLYAEQEPPKDLLLTPIDGAKVGYSDQYPRIEFSWQSVGDVTQYKLVVGKGPVPTTDSVVSVVASDQKVQIATLREGVYHWGVYAIRDGRDEPIFITPRLLTIRQQKVKAHTEKLWEDKKR